MCRIGALFAAPRIWQQLALIFARRSYYRLAQQPIFLRAYYQLAHITTVAAYLVTTGQRNAASTSATTSLLSATSPTSTSCLTTTACLPFSLPTLSFLSPLPPVLLLPYHFCHLHLSLHHLALHLAHTTHTLLPACTTSHAYTLLSSWVTTCTATVRGGRLWACRRRCR